MTTLASDNTVNSRSRLREAALPSLVGFAVLLASLLNFLSSEQYPILTPEVAILTVSLALIALTMGLVYAVSDPISRAILQFLLLLLALDLNFDGWGVLVGAAAIAVTVNRHLVAFLGIVSAVVLLTELPATTFVRPAGALTASGSVPAKGNPELPPLVHILLDEHIGVEGLISDEAARSMGDQLRAFYLDNGFHLSGGAYSEYLHTVNAIPALLNFGEEQPWLPDTSKKGTAVPNNRYFALLSDLGYAINVHQTPYVDFCIHSAVDSCRTSPASYLLSLTSDRLATSEKAALMGIELARLSNTAKMTDALAGFLLGVGTNLRGNRLPKALAGVETLGVVADQLRESPPGAAFFVHILAPHYPYIFNADCTTKPLPAWLQRQSTAVGRHTLNDRQEAYFDQIACLLTSLQPVFDAAGEEAIIIVEGDHGSRISDVDPRTDTLGRFSDADMIAGFSTIHAVRSPKVAAGYDRRALPTSLLLRKFVESGFRDANPAMPAGFSATVMLDRYDWRPVQRHPLPEGWPSR